MLPNVARISTSISTTDGNSYCRASRSPKFARHRQAACLPISTQLTCSLPTGGPCRSLRPCREQPYPSLRSCPLWIAEGRRLDWRSSARPPKQPPETRPADCWSRRRGVVSPSRASTSGCAPTMASAFKKLSDAKVMVRRRRPRRLVLPGIATFRAPLGLIQDSYTSTSPC
jgi:hypothetical protein